MSIVGQSPNTNNRLPAFIPQKRIINHRWTQMDTDGIKEMESCLMIFMDFLKRKFPLCSPLPEILVFEL